MRGQIPNFVVPTTKGANRQLVSAGSLPPQFIELTAVAVKNSAALTRGGGADPAVTRDQTSYADAFGPVADELEGLAQLIRHSVNLAKNKAGSDALTTYALAKRLAKRPETADLAPHVDDMRRAPGSRAAKVKAKPAPTPANPGPTLPQAATQTSPVTTQSPVT